MLQSLAGGMEIAITPANLVFMLGGTIMGLTFAAIPGLTFGTALVLMIPLTFNLSPICAVSLLLGIYSGGMSGGAISSILLGIPGTPSAAATVLDGYPMAQKGQPGKALGMAVFASVFGGIFSLMMLVLIAPQLAGAALTFGSPEIFAMVLFGMSTIISLSGADIVKGLMAGGMGLFLTTIGLDPIMGTRRFTFGQVGLLNGIDIMPVMIGMFALPEIIIAFQQSRALKGKSPKGVKEEGVKSMFPSFQEFKRCLPTLLMGSAVGTGIGAIPGTGGPIAIFLAYNVAKKRNPKLGTGVLEGIAAPESANNGVTGGALIPLLTLGIPGDSATAIMMGALMIHGIAPGPLLFRDNLPLVYAIFISIFIIYIMVLIIQFYGVKLFIQLLNFPRLNLMACILVVAVVGSFAVKLSYYDVVIMTISGFIAYFMKKFGFPVTPLILGVVLGGTIESSLRRSLIFSDGDLSILVSSPVSTIFLLLSLFMLLSPVFGPMIKRKLPKKQKA